MKCYVSLVCFLSAFVFVSSAPFLPGGGISGGLQLNGNTGGDNQSGGGGGGGLGGLTNILSQIDLPGLLRGVNSFVKLVGVFCPPCSQILDNVIQNVTSTAFRVFGRAILQGGGLGGGSSGGNSGGGGNSVSVVLPTFPPDEDDYDEEDSSDKPSAQIETVNRFSELDSAGNNETEGTTSKTESDDAPYISSKTEDSNVVRRHARVTREVAGDDQALAESAPQPDELDDIEDDQDRNKRFLPFGGGDGHSGGSGNFLFDIIRLVAGSGATEDSDEKLNSPDGIDSEGHSKSADHYSEGIPGPITRLFVIANRGVANLVQDLILRLAQTSERLVNFKARLITSLI